MTFHIIIQQERRTPQPSPIGDGEDRSRMAIPVATSTPTGNMIQGPIGDMPEYVTGPAQLHSRGDGVVNLDGVLHVKRMRDGVEVLEVWSFQDDPQIVAVFEWDCQSKYVIQHKGDYSARTMGYAGWPELTKEQFDALPRPDPL